MLQTVAKPTALWRMTLAATSVTVTGLPSSLGLTCSSNQTHGKEHREAGNIPPYLDLGQLDSRYPLL
jgi:hypothetical protein